MIPPRKGSGNDPQIGLQSDPGPELVAHQQIRMEWTQEFRERI